MALQLLSFLYMSMNIYPRVMLWSHPTCHNIPAIGFVPLTSHAETPILVLALSSVRAGCSPHLMHQEDLITPFPRHRLSFVLKIPPLRGISLHWWSLSQTHQKDGPTNEAIILPQQNNLSVTHCTWEGTGHIRAFKTEVRSGILEKWWESSKGIGFTISPVAAPLT